MALLSAHHAIVIGLCHSLLLTAAWCAVWRHATVLERRVGSHVLALGGLLAILAGVLVPTLGQPAWLLLQGAIRQSLQPLSAEWLVVALSLGWPAVAGFGIGSQLASMAAIDTTTTLRG
jgi:hypothetical protein